MNIKPVVREVVRSVVRVTGVSFGSGFSFSRYWATHLFGQDDLNFWVKENSRNGLTLTDSINPGAGDVSILPSCSKNTKTSYRINLGASYNPTSSCFTVYAKLQWIVGGVGTIQIIIGSAITGTDGLALFIRSTSGKLSTYIGGFRDSTLVLTSGVWVEVMYRYTTGVSGKVEMALNGSAFQTVYTGNLATSLIPVGGTLDLLSQATGDTFKGGVSEIKLWESSKGWADILTTAQKYWIFTGQKFIPDIASSPLNGIYSDTTLLSAIYDNMGSSQSLNYGYSLWQKAWYVDIHIPHDFNGNPFSVTAGIEIPAGYALTKEVAGDLLNHNLADSKLRFSGNDWSRDDITKFSSLARNTTWPAYYDSINVKDWHISEIDKSVMLGYYNSAYRGLTFPKIITNSFVQRSILKELIGYNTSKTNLDLAKILKYTNDTGVYGLDYYFVNLHYCTTRGDKILAFDDVNTMSLSLDGGATFPITLDVTGVISIVTFAYIFENGNIIFANHTKMYLSTDNLSTYAETTVLNHLGNPFVPSTYDNFKSVTCPDYINIGGTEILCWGNYSIEAGTTYLCNAWYSVDSGITIKSSKLINTARHIHAINFNSIDNSFWMQTGDTNLESAWWKGTYNIGTDVWTWIKQVDGSVNLYVKTVGMVFYNGYVLWVSDANVTAYWGIYRCLYNDILDTTKYVKVFDGDHPNIGISSYNNEMIATMGGDNLTDKRIMVSVDGGITWKRNKLVGGVNIEMIAFTGPYLVITPLNNNNYHRMDILGVGETLTNFTKGQVLMAKIITI